MAKEYYIRHVGLGPETGNAIYNVELEKDVIKMVMAGRKPEILFVADDEPWYWFAVTYKNSHRRLVMRNTCKGPREAEVAMHPLSDNLTPRELLKQWQEFCYKNGYDFIDSVNRASQGALEAKVAKEREEKLKK